VSSTKGGLGWVALLAVAAASLLPSGATAQAKVFNRHAYVGVGLGQGQGNVFNGNLSPAWMEQQVAQSWGLPPGALAGTLGRSTHELDIGGKVFAGYRFHPYGTVEAGYSNLTLSRYFKFDYQGSAGPLLGTTLNGEYRADAWWLSLVGQLPIPALPALSVYGKVGAAYTTARFDVTSTGIPYQSSAKASKWTPLLAVGAQYDFTPSWGARLEYESYGRIGDADTTGQVDARLVTLDVLYKH
jgi:opacity protein-like surface antigen